MVYYCDICGSRIKGEPIVIEIEGTVLTVCEECRKKYVSKTVKVISTGSTTGKVYTKEGPKGTTYRVMTKTQQKRVRVEQLEIVENYAEIIRSAREKLGLSREILAKLLGVKESIVRRIEEGQLMPDIELAKKLEKILGVKLITTTEEYPISIQQSSKFELTLGDIVEIRKRDEEEE